MAKKKKIDETVNMGPVMPVVYQKPIGDITYG